VSIQKQINSFSNFPHISRRKALFLVLAQLLFPIYVLDKTRPQKYI